MPSRIRLTIRSTIKQNPQMLNCRFGFNLQMLPIQGRKPHVVNPVFEPYCGRYAVKHGGVQMQFLF